MPRHHTIWDSTLGQQVDIEFTAEEEIARDTEVAEAEIEKAEFLERQAHRDALEAKLTDDSITFDEMKELMRLRG